MLKKNDITGFEKEYLWVDITNDRVFQFYLDGTGMMMYYSDQIEKAIRWEYLGENETPKNTLKIGVDGVIFYFVFKESLGEDFKVLHKSKTKSENIILSRVAKEINKKVESSSTTEDNQITPEKVKFNLKAMESSDKIFFGFMYVVSLILILVLLKSTSIIGNMSFLMVLLIAITSTTLIFIQLRDVLFFVSQKYKKEIEDIIFKK